MIDIDYGTIRIKLADIMKEQNISINKLAFRAEMQRTQLMNIMVRQHRKSGRRETACPD